MQWFQSERAFPALTTEWITRFETLLVCHYFHRVWVIQEVTLARDRVLHVSKDCVHWTKEVVRRSLAGLHGMQFHTPAPIIALLDRNTSRSITQLL